MKKRFQAAIVILFILSMEGTSPAGGFSNLDLGVQRCGMMGIVAGVEDPTMIFHNPAGLAYQDGTRVYTSGTLALVDIYLRMRDEEGNLSEKIKPTKFYGISPFIGVTSDLGLKDFAAGMALYFPNFYGAFLPEDALTRYHLIEGFFATGYISPALAWKPLDWLSVGASLNLIYVMLEGERAYTFSGEPSEDPAADLLLSLSGEDYTVGASFGMTLEPFPFLRWGLFISPQALVEPSGEINIYWHNGELASGPYSQTTYMVIPLSVRTGFALLVTSRIEFALDLSYWDYSVYDEQVMETDLFEEPFSQPKNYSDSWNIGGGIRCFASDRASFLFGLQYDRSPIPPETMSMDNPTTDLFGISGGLLYQAGRKTRLGFALVHNFYKDIDITESILEPPLNAMGEGSTTEIVFDLIQRF